MQTPIGEVVESNTASFIAEVPRDGDVPAFGSWVEIQSRQGVTLYGVISLVEYGSTMPGRRATALGKSYDELQREMPQVMELLRTSFHGRIVGYATPGGPVIQSLPPFPAGIHEIVRPCPAQTLEQFGPPFDYIQLLLSIGDRAIPGDELLIAALKNVTTLKPSALSPQPSALIQAGRVLSRLLKDDHQRLQTVLRRLSSE